MVCVCRCAITRTRLGLILGQALSKLQIGQPAPDFELPDQDGKPVRLSRFRGVSAVVIFFYPKDDTTGCTKEACAFRDELPKFDGAQVLVPWPGTPESQRAHWIAFSCHLPESAEERFVDRLEGLVTDPAAWFRVGQRP